MALGARRTDRLEALAESLEGPTFVRAVDVSDEEQAHRLRRGRRTPSSAAFTSSSTTPALMLLGPVADQTPTTGAG